MSTFLPGFTRPRSVVFQQVVSANPALVSLFPACFIGAGDRKKWYSRTLAAGGTAYGAEVTKGSGASDVFYSTAALADADMNVSIFDKDQNEYVMDVDWQLLTNTAGVNSIEWLTSSVARAPITGALYYANFKIPKVPVVDYLPRRFTTLKDQYDWSGEPGYGTLGEDVNGSYLLNGASWGPTVGMANGLGEWWSVELDPYDETTYLSPGGIELIGTGTTIDDVFTTEGNLLTAFTQALTKIMAIKTWAVVPTFPMTSTKSAGAQYTEVNKTLLPVLKQHINDARSIAQQKFRVALIGAPVGSDTGMTDPTLLYTDAQAAMVSRAMSYCAPSTPQYLFEGYPKDVDGSMIASAIAGIASNPNFDPGEPIAGKQLAGFYSIPTIFNTQQVNRLGVAGVLLVDSVTFGTPAVMLDCTTDQTSGVASQLTYTKTADFLSESINDAINKAVIYSRNIKGSAASAVTSNVTTLLDKAMELGLINAYTPVAVQTNPQESRQLDVATTITITPQILWTYTKLGIQI